VLALIRFGLEEQQLDATAARLVTEHARRNHTGVIRHEHRIGGQHLDDVGEPVIGERPVGVHVQEPRLLALGRRLLRDELWRQVEVVIRRGKHGPAGR
jgi:hypothetical protein